MKKTTALLLALAVPVFAGAVRADSAPVRDGEQREWNFRVLLDGNEVGYHRFLLTGDEQRRRLVTEAEMQVRFLFFTAYRYEHVNEEIWSGECLSAIDARTDDNGSVYRVSGRADGGRFELAAGADAVPDAQCVKTFAYWNPSILGATSLLNSQTGEMLRVEVEEVAREMLDVRGDSVPATRYRIEAPDLAIDLWYSDEREWLGLESTVAGGRKLRYELT